MNRRPITFTIEKAFKSTDKSIGIIEGLASTYSHIDYYGDQIIAGAFTKSIKKFKKDKQMIPMLSGHSHDRVIGGFDASKIKDSGDGLYVVGAIDLDTQRGKEDYSLLSKGFITGLSVGGTVNIDDMEIDKHGVRQIKNFNLQEISVTPMPANDSSRISEVKSVCRVKTYSFLPDDTVWDSEKAINQIREHSKSVDNASVTYKNGFMWSDQSNCKDFAAYKLPFTYVVDGEFKIVPKALSAIASGLIDGDDRFAIPESDKDELKKHITSYYEKMNKPSPFDTNAAKCVKNLHSSTKDAILDCIYEKVSDQVILSKLNSIVREF